jgi:hypothetical protein
MTDCLAERLFAAAKSVDDRDLLRDFHDYERPEFCAMAAEARRWLLEEVAKEREEDRAAIRALWARLKTWYDPIMVALEKAHPAIARAERREGETR